MERTLVILKPDAVERKLMGEIVSRIERRNLKITNMKMAKLSREIIEEHYPHIKDKPFFGEIVSYMTRGSVLLFVVEGLNSIIILRNLMGMGEKDVTKVLPGTIRGDYASSTTENLIHTSDSTETAEIEIRRFFPEIF